MIDPIQLAPTFGVPHPGPRLGVVVPFDFVLDREYWNWVPPEVSLHVTRMHEVDCPVGVEFAERASADSDVVQATRDLCPADPDVVVYGCTAGSFVAGVAGEARVRAAMEKAGARRARTTSGALLEALDVLGVRRLGVATPYDRALTMRLLEFLDEAGYEPVSAVYLDLDSEVIGRVSGETVSELARCAAVPGAEAVFLSCTNLPTLGLLPELEEELGVPVLSANLVTLWSGLRAAEALPQDRPELLYRAAAVLQ
jgi:maleate isomerase